MNKAAVDLRPDHGWMTINKGSPFEFQAARIAGIDMSLDKGNGSVHANDGEYQTFSPATKDKVARRARDLMYVDPAEFSAKAKALGVDLS